MNLTEARRSARVGRTAESRRISGGLAARLLALAALLVGLMACGGPDNAQAGNGGPDADGRSARPLAATVSAILGNPAAFEQRAVAIPAYVKQVINHDFLVVQDSPAADKSSELLIYNRLGGAIDFAQQSVGDRVYLEGSLQKFGQVESAANFNADDILRFHDLPVVAITSFTNYDHPNQTGAGGAQIKDE